MGRRQVLRVLLSLERYDEAKALMQTALSIKKGLTASHRDQLKSLASDLHKATTGGSVPKSDFVVACENVRVACMQDPRRDEMWNNFAYIASCTGGIQRHHKFISKVT
jgi:hypothetical protein